MTTKHCTKCNTSKTREAFSKKASSKDGLESQCKACRKKKQAAYRIANRAAIREQKVAYREAHREAIRAQKAARYEAHREAILEQQAAYRATNREAVLKRHAEYRAANPGLLAAISAKGKCGRAAPPWLTDDHLTALKQTYAQAAEDGAQVDHIVPRTHPLVSGLHVPWNVQVLEPTLNIRKRNYLPLDPEYSYIHEHDGKAFDVSAGKTVEVDGDRR